MTQSTARSELDALERVSHHERMRRMVALGRRVPEEPAAAEVARRLEAGDVYERLLALQTCYGSRDGSHALRALGDPSRLIRSRAARVAALVCDDVQALTALETAPLLLRRPLLRHLRRRRRDAPIDAYLDRLATRGDEDAGRLLPYGSAGLVRRHLDAAMAAGSDADWQRLARHHPDLAAEALRRRAQDVQDTSGTGMGTDPRLTWQINRVLSTIGRTGAAGLDAAVRLAQEMARHVPLAHFALGALAEHRPEAVADLLLAADERVHLSLDAVAHRLDAGRLERLLARQPDTLRSHERWFPELPPATRLAIYRTLGDGWRDESGALPRALVAALPAAARIAEGRRHLALPLLATRPAERLPYAAFLPWDEALAALDPFIRNPDADLRAQALAALAYGVRYERHRAEDLLALVRARRNEQDPVRRALLEGLADLPPSTWRPEHLTELGHVLREALNAADLSAASAGSAQLLVIRLLPLHPEWAVGWMATLVQERGQLYFYDTGSRLSDADVRRIAPALLPVLRAWQTREREPHLLAAAQSLGRRLRVFPELVQLLERLAEESREPWTAERAVGLIAEHLRERLHALAPALLERDKSWATRPVVYRYLHHRRQDLLSPFLGRQAYRGRFSTGKTRFVLPLTGGFFRWTPAQQATFAQTLADIIHDAQRDSPAVLETIRQVGALSAVPPTRLEQLAAAQTTNLDRRDVALRALGARDTGDGVPALLEAMGDDRARIAIYALRRALLDMPQDRALALLRDVPLQRVTVAKEAARLLGDLRSDAAYRELLDWAQRDLHRDVRIAVLRGLWPHVERDETWPVLEAAAASDDPAVATMAGRIPADRLSPAAQRRLAALVATLLAHPDPKVRLDALQRCAVLPIRDAERALLHPLLTAMESVLPDESAAAAHAVFATYAGRDAVLVGAAFQRILPNRRALQVASDALVRALRADRRRLRPTADAALAALSRDPLTTSLQVSLAAAAHRGAELAAALSRFAETGALHPDALAVAIGAVAGGRTASADPDALRQLEAALSASGDERLRRLALAALVAQCHRPHGWNAERLTRLRSYRRDPAPLVASSAEFTLPAAELEPPVRDE